MATTTSLKQLAIALFLTAALAGCGDSKSYRGAPDNGGDVGSGDDGGDNNSGDGGNDGDGGDGGNDGGDTGGGNDGGDNEPSATISGTVTGLRSTVVLRINDDIQLELSSDGAFSVGTELTTGSPYIVKIISQPSFPAQDCTLTNATGTIAGDVTNVHVTCNDLPVAALQAEPGPGHALLTWTTPPDAAHFNVYVSTARDCDIANYSACPDGVLLSDVNAPLKVRQLRDGQAYFFRVETVHTNGSRGLSNEAGARPDQLRVQGFINAVERVANGTVYVGGAFGAIGLPAGAAAPLDVHTGRLAQPDFALVSSNDGVAAVHAVASDGAGGWYLGGSFSHVGDVARRNLAHVFADGAVDPDFDPAPDSEVLAIAVFGDRVYVGGWFTTIAAQARGGLVAFSRKGGELLDWDLQAQGNAYAFAVHHDTLYIGGDFVSVEGKLFGGLAAIDASGTLRKGWRPITNGAVVALAATEDTVYAAGDFTTVSAQPHDGIVAIGRQDGQVISNWTPHFNLAVTALAASGDTVYVGGNFTTVNGQSRHYLAAIDATGQPTAWNPTVSYGVDALTLAGDTVFVGGMYLGLKAIRTDGAPLASWNSNVAIGSALAIAVANDEVYVGAYGRMMLGAVGRTNLAAIDSDGAVLPWHPFVNNAVFALASDGDTLYVGGDFTKVDDAIRTKLAAFDADGTLASWSPAANKTVAALAVSDGIVYAGGDFTSITTVADGTVLRSRLAAIDAQGQPTNWDPHVNGAGGINALAVAEGIVFAGGGFEGIGHDPVVGVQNFAAIDASSAAHLDGWQHRFTGGRVMALRVHDDAVYIGGEFTRRDGLSWSPPYLDGISLLTAQPLFWDPRVNGPVWAFDSVEHLLYFGGEFTQAGGQPRGGLAALKTPFGTISLSEWAPAGQKNVFAIAAAADVVYAAGALARNPAAEHVGINDIGVAIIGAASANGAPQLLQ